jgi:hypothetical protein
VVIADDNITIFSDQSAGLDIDTGADELLVVQGDDFCFKNFRLYGDATLSAQVILIDTAGGAINRVKVSDIYGENLFGFYGDNGGSNICFDARLSRIMLNAHRGFGIDTTKHFAYYYVDQFGLSRVGLSGAAYNYAAAHIVGAEGVFIRNASHDGTNSTSIQTSQHGFHLEDCTFVELQNIIPDHVGGNPFLLDNCTSMMINNIHAPNANLSPVRMIDCNDVSLDGAIVSSFATGDANASGFDISGGSGINLNNAVANSMKSHGFELSTVQDATLNACRARAAGGNGFDVSTCTHVIGTGLRAIANGSHGFFSAGSTRIETVGMISRDNTQRGISSGAGDTGVMHNHASLSGNVVANYYINDAGNYLHQVKLAAVGAPVDVTGVGASG